MLRLMPANLHPRSVEGLHAQVSQSKNESLRYLTVCRDPEKYLAAGVDLSLRRTHLCQLLRSNSSRIAPIDSALDADLLQPNSIFNAHLLCRPFLVHTLHVINADLEVMSSVYMRILVSIWPLTRLLALDLLPITCRPCSMTWAWSLMSFRPFSSMTDSAASANDFEGSC